MDKNSGVKTKVRIQVREMAATEAFSPIVLVVGKKAVTSWETFQEVRQGCETTTVGQTTLGGRNVCMDAMEEGEIPYKSHSPLSCLK